MENLNWSSDPLCRPIIDTLKSGKIETREFLRPVFKWMKQGGKNYDPERAFLYVDWMISLRDVGDPVIGIEQQSHIQPKYAYNTIITMSQRYDRDDIACRAYTSMIANDMEPDVFTLTALIDVMGRNGRFDEAMVLYRQMLTGRRALPNIVTYVSLIRVAGNLRDRENAADIVQSLVDDAHSLVTSPNTSATSQMGATAGGTVVISVYNAALSAFVRLKDFTRLTGVLRCMKDNQVEWTSLSFDIVSKYFWRHGQAEGFRDVSDYVSQIHARGGASEEATSYLADYILAYLQQKDKNVSEKKIYAGCLGPDAPEAMRESVIAHDLGKLLERLEGEDSSQLTENDFVTLLHQCRKRKWADQIATILARMNAVSSMGLPERDIGPVPHLAPTRLSFEAGMDGYFHVMSKREAWSLLDDMMELDDVELDDALLYFVLAGFMHCGDAELASRAYFVFRGREVVPSVETVRSLLRGLGGSTQDACRVLCDAFALLASGEMKSEEEGEPVTPRLIRRDLVLTLLRSCAGLGRPRCFVAAVETSLNHDDTALQETTASLVSSQDVDFVSVALMTACCTQDFAEGMAFIAECQKLNFLPALLCLFSFALEAMGCFVDQATSQASVSDSMPTLPFRGLLRVGAVKLVEAKTPLLARLLARKQLLGQHDESETAGLRVDSLLWGGPTRPLLAEACDATATHFSAALSEIGDDVILDHYAQCYAAHSTGLYALLYLQQLGALSVMVRCKEHKELLVSKTKCSLALLGPLQTIEQFLCDVVDNLIDLEVSNKQQAKLMALVLSSAIALEKSRDSAWEGGTWRELYGRISVSRPCLEVVKEVCRCTKDTAGDEFGAYLNQLLVTFIENRLESPVKIVQMMKQFSLHSVMQSEVMDALLVSYCLEDSTTHWMALTTYIGDHGPGKRDACRRVCRLLDAAGESELMAKMLCRFQVLHDEEFKHVMSPSASLFSASSSDTTTATATGGMEIPSEPVLSIEDFPVRVVFVDSMESLTLASGELLSPLRDDESESEHLIAIDAEWRPYSRSGSHHNKVSVLQVAMDGNVFIFDMLAMEQAWEQEQGEADLGDKEMSREIHLRFADLMLTLLSSQRIHKLGAVVDISLLLLLLIAISTNPLFSL